MANQNKRLLRDTVAKLDTNKKVNPRDLSSDQDLTIALMNMIAVEELCPDTNIGNMVADLRAKMMQHVVRNNRFMLISHELLAKSMQLMTDGINALKNENTKQAYELFDKSYEFYVLFWGVNMELISPNDISLNKGVDSNT